MSHKEILDLQETALRRFGDAAERLGLETSLREVLARPRRQLVVALPLLRDDGSVVVLDGFRVQHSDARGPSLGGLRYQPGASLSDSVARAMTNTWSATLAGVPFGGADGAIACDPRQHSPGELQRLTRRYAAELARELGPDRDVLAPDLSTDSQTMAWALDTVAALRGAALPAAVTGKPSALFGTGRADAAARGVAVCVREACQTLRKSLRTASVAFHGFGAVGRRAARLLHGEGARIVAVSDSRGGCLLSRGLDPDRLAEHKAETGSVVGFRGAERVTQDELLGTKCDCLVLAGPELQVTSKNAHLVRCRTLVEVACAGLSPQADRALADRGILAVPDLVCGAGGLIGSYFEWAQNLQGLAWDENGGRTQVEKLARAAFREPWELARARRLDLRSAATLLAVQRVAETVRQRGLFP